ncbi:MAG: hypothetical protein SPI03_03380 [Campylobacter sputorum]|uniref:hypothetical protein n=2 Tax=Campylobacter sputorum TaxID=206 RepID=UPI000B76F93A|nr:hypothetical protein [Campylobacter sputorum]ASM39064.1 putative membrane protein [Campylobacter sputorum bv. paraureolyticus LMG 11764]MDY6120369.1 hypothetical protein [Campylobacter sputorum]
MRRNSTYLSNIKYIISVLTLFLYQVFTVIMPLPPLIGVVFCYMIVMLLKKEKTLGNLGKDWYVCILYLFFVEQIHGFYLFSILIAFLLFYNFLLDWLLINMKYRSLILVVITTGSYICILLINELFAYMQNSQDFLNFNKEYFIFIGIESFISIFLFREKIL